MEVMPAPMKLGAGIYIEGQDCARSEHELNE